MKNTFHSLLLASLLFLLELPALAQDSESTTQVLFQNVRVFDGVSAVLSKPTNVLVENNMIASLSPDAAASSGAAVIDGAGRVLMPGLSDTHTHIMFASLPQMAFIAGDPSYNYIYATKDARAMLMRGITSVRDMAGNTFGLKAAIDQGLVPGPRIFPSGGMLSQTGGHGDFRLPNQTNPRFGGNIEQIYLQGHGYMVDGVPDVLAAAREVLRKGASQVKIAAGGGYSSPSDPLTGSQFTYDEIKAAVDAASNWGTYVTMHAYHPEAINVALDAGVKDVGHGQLLDEKTLRRMAKEGVFLSTQPFTECSEPQLDDFSNSKLAVVCKGTAYLFETAKKIKGLKITYGTDLFFVPQEVFAEQTKQMERLLPWYEPVEILRMATSTAGELFKMSGPNQNPYPDGDLGVVTEGAYADLLLVDGNPLDDLSAVTDPDNLKVIMKDGVIFKNTLN
jgi:imidazolonepropionase-like amidohydrolase